VAAIEPVPENCVSTVEERTKEDREKWWKMGLKAIYEGKLGVVLLSGGQVLLIIDAWGVMLLWKQNIDLALSPCLGLLLCSLLKIVEKMFNDSRIMVGIWGVIAEMMLE
jgi:hypothetical protein